MDDQARVIAAEAVVSATLEPPRRRFFSRRQKKHPPLLSNCENCGAPLAGPFCAKCGQHAVDYRRSFGRVFVDALDSFLNWDSRLFASIALLLTRPWRLTIDFLAGKRVRYVHPLRLYLLASVIFFFVANYWAKPLHLRPRHFSQQDRADIAAELKDKDIPPEIRADLEKRLNALASGEEVSPTPSVETAATPAGDYDPARNLDKAPGFEKWIEERAKEKLGEHGTKLELFLKTLLSNLPYMMLCCIPLFALVLKLLYIGRRVLYIDHLIYALHIHSFAYLGIMLIILASIELGRVAPPALAGWSIAALWSVLAAEIFFSIRRVYGQGWFVTLLKFFLGGIAYLIVLSLAFAATVLITFALPS